MRKVDAQTIIREYKISEDEFIGFLHVRTGEKLKDVELIGYRPQEVMIVTTEEIKLDGDA